MHHTEALDNGIMDKHIFRGVILRHLTETREIFWTTIHEIKGIPQYLTQAI